ncbi:MAG: hypothetical protein DMF68_18110 [Acidobacteria bacterium]|nr:MAG: hypothetical protein DMF68_18110 [Acidobacteriota bacterium]
MFDWQTIATALVILAALIYAGRLAWLRLRAFRAGRDGASSCETGCGSCGEKPKQVAKQRTVFVEISRTKSSSRPR